MLPKLSRPAPNTGSLVLDCLTKWSNFLQVQIHGRHTGLPGRALSAPSQPPRLAGQLPGSRSGDSLVSRGAHCEGSNESATSAMHLPKLAAPNLAAVGHSFRAHIQPQVALVPTDIPLVIKKLSRAFETRNPYDWTACHESVGSARCICQSSSAVHHALCISPDTDVSTASEASELEGICTKLQHKPCMLLSGSRLGSLCL